MITNQATGASDAGKNCDSRTAASLDASSDEALVAAAQAGMSDAMNQLLVRHKTALYRAARRFTSSHEDAEDLVQDAMLRAFVNVGKFRNESRFATWLTAIVNNAALSMKRRGHNIYFLSLDSQNEEPAGMRRPDVADARPNPEEEIVRQQLRDLLHSVLVRQSRTHQRLLERCVFEETRVADAASSLGMTISSAKSSLYRARRRMFDSFHRRGLVKRRNLPNYAGAVTERLKDA